MSLSSLRGVMLLPVDSRSYVNHTAHHTFVARVNSTIKTADPQNELTKLVEDQVRQEMQRHFSATSLRILRWEQIDRYNRYVVKFRELDGVFKAANGTTVILEVKASASLSSLRSGMVQLRTGVKTASRAFAKIIGILVVADLGEWFDTFGSAATQPPINYFASKKDVGILEWPPRLSIDKTSGIYVCAVPGSTLYEWLPIELSKDPA